MSQVFDTTCPHCGKQLTPHAGHWDSAPYFCGECHRGFWVAELSAKARAHYRPSCHDWGYAPEAKEIRTEVSLERDVAGVRGTSARAEHLKWLSKHELQLLKRRNLHPDFRKLVDIAHNDGKVV